MLTAVVAVNIERVVSGDENAHVLGLFSCLFVSPVLIH